MKVVVLQERDERGAVHLLPVGGAASVGREASTNQIVVRDPHVSRAHCALEGLSDGRVRVVDLGRAGTFVDDARVDGEAIAGPGARLRIGPAFELRVIGAVDPGHDQYGEPRPPCRLGARYLLLAEAGRGGMGVVFEAWDLERGRRCALKWLAVGGGWATDEDVARFTREAQLQASLSDHPGIARVFDQGRVPGSGHLYCIMEYVDGVSLERRIREATLSRLEATRVVARVARAAEFAHARGVVHRDIKPSNVLVSAKGMVRLTDFGIARALDGSGRLTATGIMLGTPGFMAPEQIQALPHLGPAVDVYGIGAVLYTCLTGAPPARGASVSEVLRNAVAGRVDAPRQLDPTIDPALERACLRALALEPGDRHPDAGALAEELEAWLRAQDPPAPVRLSRPPSAPSPFPRRP
ncbi:MAG: serine/threonine-protein kinase [Planctomycetes bacterium]|nr:serine/threonine-protein kinase [Planctomycetota bacterium]